MNIQAGSKPITVDLNIAPIMRPEAHGKGEKDLIVLHETVSPDCPGLSDVLGVSQYMASKGLGIHGIIDGEGHLAWAYGMRDAVLYHTASNGGSINTRGIGIELISRVMIDKPDNQSRWEWWWKRDRQIDKLAQLLAFISTADGIPLSYSSGHAPGVTTHWQITKTYGVDGGHTDCWPRHLGGYFPVLRIIERARYFKARGW